MPYFLEAPSVPHVSNSDERPNHIEWPSVLCDSHSDERLEWATPAEPQAA